jgi:hypothetical protein
VIKNADSAETNALSIMDKLIVFRVRGYVPKSEILSFNGNSFFVYAVKSGMVGKSSVSNVSIGEVTVNGSFANGQFAGKKPKKELALNFYKENGQWKIDLTSLFPLSTSMFRQMQAGSGKSENVYLCDLLETVTNKKPGNQIWHPVK